MIEQTTSVITTILAAVTEFVTAAIQWVGSFAEAIVSNELILIFVIVSLVGLGCGLLRRLIRM